MTIQQILIWIVIGGIAGLLAKALIRGVRLGLIGTILVGILTRAWFFGAAVVLLVVALGVVACAQPAPPTPAEGSVPAIKFDQAIQKAQGILNGATMTPPTAKILAEWKVSRPVGFAFGFDSVWVPSHRDPNATTRIDPVSNKVIAGIEGTGWRSHAALVVGDSVWISGERDDLSQVDPKTNKVVTQVKGGHTYLAYGFNSLWSTTRDDKLDRIDPITSQIVASITLGDGYVDCNNDVLTTPAAVWVDHCDEQELIRIDPTASTIVSKTPYKQLIAEAQARTTLPAGKATDFIWRTLPTGLLRIDPGTGAGLTFLPLNVEQMGAGWVTVTDDAVWLSGYGQIDRVKAATNQIDATYKVHDGETKVGTGFGSVWVAYEGMGLVQRLDIVP